MQTQANLPEQSQVSGPERARSVLVKKFIKLRWVGMEAEAEALKSELRSAKVGNVSALLDCPRETD